MTSAAAVRMLARAGLRRARGRVIALAVLLGVIAGVVLASAAGARRTSAAFPDYLRRAAAPDVFVIPTPGQQLDLDRVAHLPQVATWGRFAFVGLVFSKDGQRADVNPFADVAANGTINVPVVVSGRRADPTRPGEITVNPAMAHRFGLHVGDRLSAALGSHDQVIAFAQTGQLTGALLPQSFEVVGVIRYPGDVGQEDANTQPSVFPTTAYYRAHRDSTLFEALAIRLRHGGADVPAFERAVEPLSDQPVPFETGQEDRRKVERAIHPQALALALFALFAAIVGGFVVGQAIAREALVDEADARALMAVGLRRREIVSAAVLRSVVVACGAAALAVATALALSPLAPIGLARQAQSHASVAADWTVLAAGAATVIAFVLARTALAAWQSLRHGDAASVSPSRTVEALARVGAPASAVTGVRLAVERGRGGRGLPTAGAIAAAVAALAGTLIAFTFGASLHHVEQTPRLYGWTWDLALDGSYGPDLRAGVGTLDRTPLVRGYVGVAQLDIRVAGVTTVNALALGPTKGHFFPATVQGRIPDDGELFLGTRTWRRVHARVGKRVQVSVGGRSLVLRLSGEGVLPAMGTTGQGLQGDGAVMTLATAQRLVASLPVNVFLLQTAPGASVESIGRELGPSFPGVQPVSPQRPAEVTNLARVDQLPFLLTGLLVLVGLATLVHTIVTSVRRNGRDLAVLKTLGFVRRQLSATVAWQATTFAVVAIAIGVPLGVAGGRWLWSLFARELGLLAEPVVVPTVVVSAAVATVAAANIAALVPARTAARVRAATVLRAE